MTVHCSEKKNILRTIFQPNNKLVGTFPSLFIQIVDTFNWEMKIHSYKS